MAVGNGLSLLYHLRVQLRTFIQRQRPKLDSEPPASAHVLVILSTPSSLSLFSPSLPLCETDPHSQEVGRSTGPAPHLPGVTGGPSSRHLIPEIP